MKFCPACQTRYEEEILRFCIKDGTPLVEETAPQFTELPSESMEEYSGEVTIIRRTTVSEHAGGDANEPQRLIIPTKEPPKAAPPRQRRQVAPAGQSPQPNIFKVIVLTIIGTLVVLAGIGMLVWSLKGDGADNVNGNQNSNVNTSVDTNMNTSVNISGVSVNMNTNLNWNVNFNVNANANSNLNRNVNAAANVNLNRPLGNVNGNSVVRPTPTPAANSNTASGTSTNRPANRPSGNTSPPGAQTRPRSVNR